MIHEYCLLGHRQEAPQGYIWLQINRLESLGPYSTTDKGYFGIVNAHPLSPNLPITIH